MKIHPSAVAITAALIVASVLLAPSRAHACTLYAAAGTAVDDGGVMLKLISKGIGWSLVRPATLVQHPDLAARVHFCKMPDPVMQREVILIFGKSVNPELVDTVETLSKSFYEAELSKEFKKILQQK